MENSVTGLPIASLPTAVLRAWLCPKGSPVTLVVHRGGLPPREMFKYANQPRAPALGGVPEVADGRS